MSRSARALMARAPMAALRSRYDEPWRHYHAWPHPQAMLRHLEAACADGVIVVDEDAAVGFILWHDAIYDPQAGGGRNERLSAALCRAEMAGLAAAGSVDRAVRTIEATIDHCPPDGDCPDAPLLLDIDLAVLGAAPAVFDAYDAAIRREYRHVPDADYRRARRHILTRFLERERLYLSDWGYARWETAARANLVRAIERLC